jgi:hypothetical protein
MRNATSAACTLRARAWPSLSTRPCGGSARRLVVAESTFSWWAAVLGGAREVHAPGAGAVPVPYAEQRYVFHDAAQGRYWGNWSSASNAVEYAYAARPAARLAARPAAHAGSKGHP